MLTAVSTINQPWSHSQTATADIPAAVPRQVMGDMMLYPNSMSFDVMEGGGVQPPPQGILQVTVVRIPKLKGGGDLLSKVWARWLLLR